MSFAAGVVETAGKAAASPEASIARTVKKKSPKVRVRKGHGANQKPVITSMTIILGLNMLHSIVVDKKNLPDRTFWVRMGVLGFGLALMADLAPKLGKWTAYLVMTAVIFDRSQGLLRELGNLEKGASPTAGAAIGPDGIPVGFGSVAQDRTQPIVLHTASRPTVGIPIIPGAANPKRKAKRPHSRYFDPSSPVITRA